MLEGMVRKQTEKQAQTLDSWLEKHDREVPFPERVCLHGDQDYMGDGKPCHRMDVYEPELNPKEGPVLVNFHGGGFLLGKKQVNRLFCADMCLHGFTVFCPEYPLVPEVGIFDIFRDLTVAVNRAGEEAAARGQDGVCLCGDSAGAYLCVYLAAMRENPAMAEAAGVSPVVPRIRALGLISGMFYTCRLDSIGMFLPDMLYGKGWRKLQPPLLPGDLPGQCGALPAGYPRRQTAVARFFRYASGNAGSAGCKRADGGIPAKALLINTALHFPARLVPLRIRNCAVLPCPAAGRKKPEGDDRSGHRLPAFS